MLSYEEQMDNLYSDNRKSRDTFIIGCIFSLLISIFGLTGYIGGEANRRSKEIAIRKINGAQSSDITAMFAADLLLVLLAVIAAATCSYRISRANPVESIKNE